LSAVTTTAAIAEAAEEKGYYQSSSHTGDPFLSAVGLANIEIIEREGLLQNAVTQGDYLKESLLELGDRYEVIGDVRGVGLMLGVEVVTDRDSKRPGGQLATAISSYAFEHGLLLGHRPGGVVGGHVIRLLPPLTVRRDEVDEALEILEAAVAHAVETSAPEPGLPSWM
jgi:4-aminobutyrate aminotransferase-like enzyme